MASPHSSSCFVMLCVVSTPSKRRRNQVSQVVSPQNHYSPIRSAALLLALSFLPSSIAIDASPFPFPIELLGPAAASADCAGMEVDGAGLRLSSSAWRSLTSDERRGIRVGLERIIAGLNAELYMRYCFQLPEFQAIYIRA